MEAAPYLTTPLSECRIIHGTEAAALKTAGFGTIEDILKNAPSRHEDRRRFDNVPTQESPVPVCLRVKIMETKWCFQGRGRRYFEAVVEESSFALGPRLSCRWFHFPAISRMLATGMELILYGRVKRFGKSLTMVHPEFEVMENSASNTSIHLERIVPVYRKRGGLNQRRYRELVWKLLKGWEEECGMAGDGDVQAFLRSLKDLHFPETLEDAVLARKHFAREECFYLQLAVLMRRRELRQEKGLVTVKTTHLVKDLTESLPFELTESQKECVREIYRDMKRPVPMNRLLQGDVGSGKTLVSFCAMLMAVEAGFQVAMMAPTQILAEQHYKSCRLLLDPLGVKIALKTSSKAEETLGWGSGLDSRPQIVMGTHALLYRKDTFDRLGLVVIDEQHKFGVEQRDRLISQGDAPDVLVMTATPIPRTLTLTLYGDLDVSILREKPAGRGRIVTAIRTEAALPKVVKFVQQEVDQGRQVYVVSPLVEESEGERKRKGKSAVSEWETWKKWLPHVDIGLLHGRMNGEEKESVMEDFRKEKYSVLVSTTVIEVGVDVPNATIMIINNPDQFGLSQLHQLRGRVGRGGQKSYCILVATRGLTEEGKEKLQIFEQINDGFDLAEADFRLRGPGDILGTEQSGLGGIDFPEWLHDTGLIVDARKRAEALLESDPHLERPEHANIRDRLVKWRTKVSN